MKTNQFASNPNYQLEIFFNKYQKQMWMPFLHDCKPVNDFLPFYPFMIKPQPPIHTRREENPRRNIILFGSIFFIFPVDTGWVTRSPNCGFYTDSVFKIFPHENIFSSICKTNLLSEFWRDDIKHLSTFKREGGSCRNELKFQNDWIFFCEWFIVLEFVFSKRS